MQHHVLNLFQHLFATRLVAAADAAALPFLILWAAGYATKGNVVLAALGAALAAAEVRGLVLREIDRPHRRARFWATFAMGVYFAWAAWGAGVAGNVLATAASAWLALWCALGAGRLRELGRTDEEKSFL